MVTQLHRTSAAVIEAVASKEGVKPRNLTPPLYDVIDTDALNALCEGGDSADGPTVRFTYHNYCIKVDGPESVTAERIETEESTC